MVRWKRNENPEVLFVRIVGYRQNVYYRVCLSCFR